MTSRICSALLLLVAGGCGGISVSGNEFGGPPKSFRGFPSLTLEGIVYAEARYTDHAADLGIDLVEYERVLPILLQVRLRGQGADEAQIVLKPARMDLRLVLPDGTVLRPAYVDDIASRQDEEIGKRIRSRAFKGGLLEQEPTEGYVLFALQPAEQFEVSGREIRHVRDGVVRTFDLAKSLLAFDLSIGESTITPFYVGVQP